MSEALAADRLLVDTHALLWFLFDDRRLSARADRQLSDPTIEKVVSVVTLWEIATKVVIGKLALGMTYAVFQARYIAARQVEVLDIELHHLVTYASLPLHHRDPFDRLIIAQAASDGLPVLTRDPSFASYPVTVLWE